MVIMPLFGQICVKDPLQSLQRRPFCARCLARYWYQAASKISVNIRSSMREISGSRLQDQRPSPARGRNHEYAPAMDALDGGPRGGGHVPGKNITHFRTQ